MLARSEFGHSAGMILSLYIMNQKITCWNSSRSSYGKLSQLSFDEKTELDSLCSLLNDIDWKKKMK